MLRWSWGKKEKGHSFVCQNVILAADKSVLLELKGGPCRVRASRDRRHWPETGFVSKLSLSLPRDTRITTGLTTAESRQYYIITMAFIEHSLRARH